MLTHWSVIILDYHVQHYKQIRSLVKFKMQPKAASMWLEMQCPICTSLCQCTY